MLEKVLELMKLVSATQNRPSTVVMTKYDLVALSMEIFDHWGMDAVVDLSMRRKLFGMDVEIIEDIPALTIYGDPSGLSMSLTLFDEPAEEV